MSKLNHYKAKVLPKPTVIEPGQCWVYTDKLYNRINPNHYILSLEENNQIKIPIHILDSSNYSDFICLQKNNKNHLNTSIDIIGKCITIELGSVTQVGKHKIEIYYKDTLIKTVKVQVISRYINKYKDIINSNIIYKY